MGLKPTQRGALVTDVMPGSPAEQAGVRGSKREVLLDGEPVRLGGDVVVAIDARIVKTFDDLLTYLARATEVGQTVELTVLRQDDEDTLRVTLNARPRSDMPRSRVERAAVGGIWLGITGQTVTPKVAQAMHLPATQRGVMVEKVERGSPADQAGLRGTDKTIVVNGLRVPVGGDIVVAFDDKPVTQVQDLQTLVRRAQPGQTVKLTIVRQGKRMRLQVTLTERSGIRP
jgi:S1-C subfamily serine protease